jgi:flagellar motility protein MotE (MotC chaperone)
VNFRFIHRKYKYFIINLKETTNIDKESDSINTELKQLEKLKSKIKDLENKIGEINKDEKEKKIIDSLREFRNRNMSPIYSNISNI